MTVFSEDLRIDGQRIDASVEGRVTDLWLVRTMEGASSLELTVADADMALLRSGVLARPGQPNRRQARIRDFDQAAWSRFGSAQLVLDGWFTRLAGVSGAYDQAPYSLTITFEDEIASLMRRQTKALKASRGTMSRADFMHWLARRSMHSRRFGFYSPEEDQKQKVREPEEPDRQKGIHPDAHLTIKGFELSSEQRKHLTTSLKVADELGAGERATLAMLVAGIGESSFTAVPNSTGSNYGGVFQGQYKGPSRGFPLFKISDTKGQATYFLKGGRGFQQGGAIKAAADHPDWSAGTIAYKVEGSRTNFGSDAQAENHYQQWHNEAKAILEAWGGVYKTVTRRQRFEFRAGGKRDGKQRNYWDDSRDLADKVRWRRFADRNTLWFVTDEWLFTRKPVLRIDDEETRAGNVGITFDADVGLPVAQITLRVRLDRWQAPPGGVVELEDWGPLDGRWLIWQHRQPLLNAAAFSEITLRRPAPKVAEPASSTRTTSRTESAPEKGTDRERIVSAAKRALAQKNRYKYAQVRPYPSTLFPENYVSLIRTDCSGFATLIYKAAGVPDPNGRGYDGQGYTGTLWANGKRTTDPQPGDLVFYGNPTSTNSHVAIYIGGGEAIGFGSDPMKRHPANYRAITGYRTYDLTN